MTCVIVALNLTFLKDDGCEINYELQSLIFHAGKSLHKGHFYVFAKRDGGVWWKIDDNKVTKISVDFVLAESAKQQVSIAFYTQVIKE